MKYLRMIDGVWVDINTGDTFLGIVPRDLDVGDVFESEKDAGTVIREVTSRVVRRGFVQITVTERSL